MNKYARLAALVPLIVFSCRGVLLAELIIAYEETGQIVPPTAAGVTANTLTQGGGLTPVMGLKYGFSGWDQPTLPKAIEFADYFEWGFESAQPFHLNDFSIRFSNLYADQGPDGIPMDVVIQASLNGGTEFETIFSESYQPILDIPPFPPLPPLPVIETGPLQQAFSSEIQALLVTDATFRLYAFNPTEQGGMVSNGEITLIAAPDLGFNAIEVRGSPAAVPEATTLMMFGGFLTTGCLLWRRRA